MFIANGLYLTAYFMTDMLRMRVLTAITAVCLTVYFYCQPEPMLTIVGWNLVFVTLNLVQITQFVTNVRNCSANFKK